MADREPKINRQIFIYHIIKGNKYNGPEDINAIIPVKIRTLQRDIKDLTDAGLIKVKYDKKEGIYKSALKDGETLKFNENVTGRRRDHLLKLYRLCYLSDNLESTPYEDIRKYELEYEEHEFILEDARENPEEYEGLSDDFFDPPKPPEIKDAREHYRTLFPGLSVRTMLRDFKIMNHTGMDIHYYPKYKAYLIRDED